MINDSISPEPPGLLKKVYRCLGNMGPRIYREMFPRWRLETHFFPGLLVGLSKPLNDVLLGCPLPGASVSKSSGRSAKALVLLR